MAAAVVDLRYRESWNSAANNSRATTNMLPTTPTGHHGKASELDDFAVKPRLPSISNFLQGAGQSPLQHNPATFSTSLPFSRPISNPSVNPSPWSPKDDMRQKLQFDQRPPYHIRSVSDSQYDSQDYRAHASSVFNQALASEPQLSRYGATIDQALVTQPPSTASKRVVREESIPGKGLCYIYDDGTICQKIINGDTVNPKWGTTKAGKPRKRLGQACNTCREKKIKCDPSFPKCTQCQKFNRECKFDPTARSNQRSPKLRSAVTSPSDSYPMDDSTPYRHSSGAATETPHNDPIRYTPPPQQLHENDQHDQYIQPRQPPYSNSKDPITPPKRPCPTDSATELVLPSNKRTTDGPMSDNVPPEEPFTLSQSPYHLNKNVVRTYLHAYFTHSDTIKHQLVPRKMFMDWVEDDRKRSPASILVIYAMLSWGCAVTNSSEATRYGSVFAEIALEGVMQPAESFSLPLIQARVVFAMHQYLVGHNERAWDLCGSALRAACAMSLNTEDGIMTHRRESQAEYGLDPIRLAESMRRTFWSIYQIDRFGVSCLGYGTPFHRANLCLRLPCHDSAFASGDIAQCPMYDGEEGIIIDKTDDVSAFNKTVMRRMQVATLLCDVQSLATRSRLQTFANQAERMAVKRKRLETKLLNWNAEYTKHLQASDQKTTSGDIQKFGGLHVLYHHASMVLHRYIHHAHLTSGETAHHIKLAHHHAYRTLEIAQQLVSHGNKSIYDYYTAADDPTTGYAIVTAIDIITAAGLNSDILENQSRLMGLILPGIELIDRIAHSWHSARRQQELVSQRIQFLLNSAKTGVANGKVAFFIADSIAVSHGEDNDLIYGGDRLRYLNALSLGSGINYQSSDIMKIAH